MSRFNEKSIFGATVEGRTTADGQQALALTPAYELYSLVCTSLLGGDKYYETGTEQLNRMEKLVKQCSPAFVANLASYARNEMNMRSVPMLLIVMLTQHHRGCQESRQAVRRVLKRADEFGELLGCFANVYGKGKTVTKGAHAWSKKLAGRPNALVRGIRDVFEEGRFNEYQFSKYSQDKKDFTIRDALFVSHPKPKDKEQEELFKKIAEKKLETAERWEVASSRLGKATNEQKLGMWTQLLAEKKLPHMALLRNIRNILECEPTVEQLDVFLTELRKGVAKGKQFPFRYWTAYKYIQEINPMKYGRLLQGAFNACLMESARNSYTVFNQGQNLFACDVSGSMDSKIGNKGEMTFREIGLVLGCTLAETKQASYGIFGNTWRYCDVTGNPLVNIKACNDHGSSHVGHGTSPETMVAWLLQHKLTPDNVVVFTDMQFNNLDQFRMAWEAFKRQSPKTKLWFIDLTGYGNVPIRIDNKGVYFISGWNDKVFEIVRHLEQGSSALEMIEKYVG